jgi:predicted dehydrogenase
MTTREIGIVMHGVTGRMGATQHLERSILAIMRDGGVRDGDDVIMPRPILAGRNADKLEKLATRLGSDVTGEPLPWTTDLPGAIRDDCCDVVFDAASTAHRPAIIEMAAAAGKAVYCEKPTALTLDGALRAWRVCERAGVRNGVVQDKLFLPGIIKLRALIDRGFFGQILSIRGEFGYWVFTGHDRPAQRPSWNYRSEDGGGIMTDMFCHWQYVLEHLVGPLEGVFALASTDIHERIDEAGNPYVCTADDAAYAIFRAGGVICQFNSSWTTRVRRDDLLTIQIDGTEGSAVAGLRECRGQSLDATPRPVWNPDVAQETDFYAGWNEIEPDADYPNAFRVQWEQFLRYVVHGGEWKHDLLQGAKGVQLAEAGRRSSMERRWVDIEPLDGA